MQPLLLTTVSQSIRVTVATVGVSTFLVRRGEKCLNFSGTPTKITLHLTLNIKTEDSQKIQRAAFHLITSCYKVLHQAFITGPHVLINVICIR